MYDDDFLKFISRLGIWFQEAEDDQLDVSKTEEALPDDLAIIKVLETLNKEILKDEELLNKLFKVYQENLGGE